MSKKKSKKGGKKTEPEIQIPPTKTTMQILFEQYLNSKSLTLSQQKYIVSALRLSNNSLYDSIIIDIITEFLTFCKKLQITPNQTDRIYYIIQNILYKISNDIDCNLQQLADYLNKRLSLQINKASQESNNDDTSNEKTESIQSSTEYITTEQSESIKTFIHQRILSQYTLYRAALFENNPSNLQFAEFKQDFEIGDIVQFQDKECLFKIEEFRSNDIILSCLHNDFKALEMNEEDNDKDINNTLKYIVSKDQTQFISFMAKPESEKEVDIKHDIIEKEEVNENVNNDENEDITNEPIEEQQKEDIDDEEEVNKKDVDNENIDRNIDDDIQVIADDVPKTLIDVIVNKKVEQKLKSMQEKFDNELEQYKEEIVKLQKEHTSK